MIIPKFGGNKQNLNYFRLMCWSPDGSIVASTNVNFKSIYFIKRETNEIINKIGIKGNFSWIFSIDWSPKSNLLSFLTSDGALEDYTLWTIKIDGTKQKEIYKSNKELLSTKWDAGGDFIYSLCSNNFTKDLIKININNDDNEPELIQTGIQAFGFSITSDNKKLLYTKYLSFSNLWKFTFNERTKIFFAEKLTNGSSRIESPHISPDEKRLAFISQGNVFLMDISGGEMQQLTFLQNICKNPNWRPDGKELAFISGKKVYSIPLTGRSPNILNNSRVGEYDLTWETDSKLLYQTSGNRNFQIHDFITGEERLLVSNDSVGWMFNPCISTKGDQMAVLWERTSDKLYSGGIWIISLNNSLQRLLLKGYNYFPIKWSNDDHLYLYTKNRQCTIRNH